MERTSDAGPIHVLVTAIGGGGHGDQILKALRLAKPGRYRLFGADQNPSCPQRSMVERFVTLPAAHAPRYMDALLTVCRNWGVQALFHGCEPELNVFAKHRSAIDAAGIFLPINRTELIEQCMDKAATNQRLAELGFPSPRFARVSDIDELVAIDWFPVVVKPAVGSGGSANVFIAQNQRELRALADYLGLGTLAGHFMVQEYVGTPEEEFTVGVLHGLDGEYINSIAVRRHLKGGLNVRTAVVNRTANAQLGPRLVISSGISHGDIGRFDSVTAQCRDIATKLGSTGPLNVQCRVVDGVVKVFEINPRFSGTTSIRAMVGFNEPDILLRRHLLGERIEVDFGYREATILRGLTEYFVPDQPQDEVTA
ncbi:MAG: ATP-grasp domain-containing protein [Rubrivivax sp.]|nr:ATP-grasp domain-containing protein [Rubrivivax sp.]